MENVSTEEELPVRESNDEKQCLEELRLWVETEAAFYGRTDDSFLLIFIRGCKLNMVNAKKKMFLYYENRKRAPQWWANRNINDMGHVIELNTATLMSDKEDGMPCLAIYHASRVPKDNFETFMKYVTTVLEVLLRRPNCQSNGVVAVFNALDIPLWLIAKYLNPMFMYNLVKTILMALPLRVKGVYVINCPAGAQAVWSLLKPMLSKKMQKRFLFCRSDWSTLKEKMNFQLLPVEYGGDNGSIHDHQEAFNREIYSYCQYILNDEKYGFQTEFTPEVCKLTEQKS